MNTRLNTITEEPNRLAPGKRTPRLRWASLAAAALAGMLAVGTVGAQGTATTEPADATPSATPATPAAPTGGAGINMVSQGLDVGGAIHLMVGRSQVITTKVPYSRVNVGEPDVVTPIPIDSRDILLAAKHPGSTQLIIWDDQNRSQSIDVTVETDLGALRAQLGHAFPGVNVDVSSANGTVVLKGRVPTVTMADQIMKVAAPYSPAAPLNLMEVAGGQQVVLQVRFAEVSRSLKDDLGFNIFTSDKTSSLGVGLGSPDSPLGALFKGSGEAASVPTNTAVFGAGQFGNTALEYFVEALRENGLLRWLAEPNLLAMSGQTADFNAGGLFPYPVPQPGNGGTTITIQFQKYGVELQFTPVVLGDGRIRLNVAPDVSELDYSNAFVVQGYTVPGLTERKLNTTVELGDGQTLALAGLLQRQINATSSITPLLGDIPVLGTLFRSTSYQDNDTELVVLITPHLVGPMNPGEVPAAPGEKWRYPTEAQLFLNHDLGGPLSDSKNGPNTQPARFYGHYGFAPATTPDDAASSTTAPAH